MSVRELAGLAATLAAAPAARTARMPNALLRLAGVFNAAAREIPEVRYQFDRPFVIDSTQAQKAFGLEPTPTEDALLETVRAAQGLS
jgi:nucleoside-diphosphate-sugar epimerase